MNQITIEIFVLCFIIITPFSHIIIILLYFFKRIEYFNVTDHLNCLFFKVRSMQETHFSFSCVYAHLHANVMGESKLKLPSLFAAWLFWTCHTKSHNMKALLILSHSWLPFLQLTCLYEKNELLWVSVLHSWKFSWKKLFPDYKCKSHDYDHKWAALVMARLP